ncbi:chorismate--pyruvate lyase family protein [Methanocaldococcus sp.]
MKVYKRIAEINKSFPLLNEEKILLGTDGSVTNILEILFEDECMVKTLSQKIVDNVNYREVILLVKSKPLVYAKSIVPLNNIEKELREEIKKDLLLADIPIGKILKRHNLETRREIKEISIIKLDDKVKDILKVSYNKLPMRKYNIILKGKPIMEIMEIFAIRKYLGR